LALIGVLAVLVPVGIALAARSTSAVPRAGTAASCPPGRGSHRVASNPLGLPAAPGANPLSGADFFVDGPGHGLAAGAIATLIGRNPARYKNESWPRFARSLARTIKANSALARNVALLEKIAVEPETARFSIYSAGGGSGAILSQVRKFFKRMRATDRCAVPLIATYFLNHTGNCATNVDGPGAQAIFRRRVHELALGIGRRAAVVFAEIDAVDTAGCLSPAGLAARISELKYELDALGALRHAVAYVEGGVSDANTAAFAARILNASDVSRIRGFYLNDTHFEWTSTEIAFGDQLSRLTGGKHFIVNTADNGQGPLLNPHPVSQGIEDLCNPPGRGMGPQPSTATGFALVDAFEWTGTPGRSSGHCGVGTTSGGVFDVNLALYYAARANNQLGPGYPSRPY
jgi:endoglucanase